MTDQETTGTGAVQDSPSTIYAKGPDGTAEQSTEVRTFDNNVDAFDAKARQAFEAQAAPNPTTDADLAREAYGEDWNRRRGHKLIATASEDQDSPEGEGDTEALYEHGGTVVDNQGHVLGHASDVDQAVAAKHDLGSDGEVGRYPVTAEAQEAELRERNDDGETVDENKTLDGGLGVAVDPAEQQRHDEIVTDDER